MLKSAKFGIKMNHKIPYRQHLVWCIANVILSIIVSVIPIWAQNKYSKEFSSTKLVKYFFIYTIPTGSMSMVFTLYIALISLLGGRFNVLKILLRFVTHKKTHNILIDFFFQPGDAFQGMT